MKQRDLKFLFEATFHTKFSFGEFEKIDINKEYEVAHHTSNGKSDILRSSKKLKEFQRFLNIYIFEFLPINERCVFSYRKGFSAVDAVRVHRNSKYFFQTDISSFFNSINNTLIRETLLHGKDCVPVSDVENYIDQIVGMVCVDGSMPIGFPSSSPLSNAVLFNFDNSIEKYCESKSIHYSRYADDIVLSSLDKESLSYIDEFVEKELSTLFGNSFSLNEKKTKYYHSGGDINILGISILPNGVLTIDKKIRNEIELGIFLYLKDKENFEKFILQKKQILESRDNKAYAIDRLSGLLNYAKSVNEDYIDKLRRKFGVTVIDMLIHRQRTS